MSTSAKVTSIQRNGDVVTTIVQVDKVESDPIAPASLFSGDKAILKLHKLVSNNENLLTFESYDLIADAVLPQVGQELTLISLWTPWQLELAKSEASVWTKKMYPENGDHDHCALTWETIASYGDYVHEAYTNGSDWITPDAFNRYIVRDEAHVRLGYFVSARDNRF